MEINELNKKQLVLLTLLITFVVSIATGIVTVSLMQQMPKSVPQTINNVIQRTIEKVTTVEVPVSVPNTDEDKKDEILIGDGDAIVLIYAIGKSLPDISSTTDTIIESDITNDVPLSENTNDETKTTQEEIKPLGEGIIISDVGLILVESSILNGYERYKVVLDKTDFEVSVLKKFENGFTVLKILSEQDIKDIENSSAVKANL